MELKRVVKVLQSTAWFIMMQRIRDVRSCDEDQGPLDVQMEFDETYVGGKHKNKSNAERKKAKGRGLVDLTAAVGAKHRESNDVGVKVVQSTCKDAQQGFVDDMADPATVIP